MSRQRLLLRRFIIMRRLVPAPASLSYRVITIRWVRVMHGGRATGLGRHALGPYGSPRAITGIATTPATGASALRSIGS